MSGAIVQSIYAVDDSGGASSTIAATLTGVTAGNMLVVFVGWGDDGVSASCSDGTAYTSANHVANATDNQPSEVFYLPNVAGGSHTVTVTFGSNVAFRRMRVIEVSGIATSSPLDQATGARQTNPGTGTDGISSGASSATTNANDYVMGFTQDVSDIDPGTGTLSAGTGYSLSGTNIILGVEGKNVSSTGAQTATFTQSVANTRTTHVVAFKTAAAGAVAIFATRLPQFPNRGPNPKNYGARRIGFRNGLQAILTQTFSYVASGGLTFGGAAASARVKTVAASGGLTFGGVAAEARVKVITPSGGLTFGGAATFAKGKTVTPSGGLTFGGAAAQARVKVTAAPSGGIVFGGAASVSFVGTQRFSYTASGGLTFGGIAASARVSALIAAGGITFGGASAVSYHQSTRIVSPSGGIVFSGVAGASFFSVGSGNASLPSHVINNGHRWRRD